MTEDRAFETLPPPGCPPAKPRPSREREYDEDQRPESSSIDPSAFRGAGRLAWGSPDSRRDRFFLARYRPGRARLEGSSSREEPSSPAARGPRRAAGRPLWALTGTS